ncbi:MAG: hypothetical protein IKV41_02000 [Oscillospiraceae bacterium]|nr:hypothetical protein [Oscillospiraceae bacterium]
MKKFVSMALAAAMLASMSVPAFAFKMEGVKAHDGYDFDVNDVRIAKHLVHRGHNDGVRILFFPFECRKDGVSYPIQGGVNIKDEADWTDGKTQPIHFSDVEDFQDMTWTVKFDEDCKQYLRAAEQIHDAPTFIYDTGNAVKNQDKMERGDVEAGAGVVGVFEGLDHLSKYTAGAANVYYTEMEGLKVVLNENTTTGPVRISGTVKLKHKGKELDEYKFSYTYKNNQVNTYVDKDDDGVDNSGFIHTEGDGTPITVIDDGRYEVVPLYEYGSLTDDFASEVSGDTAYIDLRGTARSVTIVKFTKDVEEIELEDHHGFYFNVKASDQGKVNLSYENGIQYSNMWIMMNYMGKEFIPAGADARYFNFKAKPEFDFTGTATITLPDEDVQWYLYNLDPATCQWSPVTQAKLTEDGDAFEFKTRQLGCYLLIDTPMPDLTAAQAPATEAPAEEEAAVVNPATGGEEA